MAGSLDSITSNAASGLRASQLGIAVLGDNIANAGVAGYTAKQLDLSTFTVSGRTSGVRTGLVSRSVDDALQTSVWTSTSRVEALTARSEVLQAVNATQGTPGDGTSIPDGLSKLQSSITLLQAQPSGSTLQASAVASATNLAGAINRTADEVIHQRNQVEGQISTAVDGLNAALATVRSTTSDIIKAKGAGQDTADLEDTRDAALGQLSGLLDLHYDKQANGDITILGRSGFSLPTDSRFSTAASVLSPAAAYTPVGMSVPSILLSGSNPSIPPVDVTGQVIGGRLGELIRLRDTTLPSYTASLDDLSAKIANRFSAQGLQLFTDGSTTTPLAAYAGLSSQIQVNPAVLAAPSTMRDGTGSGGYPANPASGPAGYHDLLDRLTTAIFAGTSSSPSLEMLVQGFISQQATAAGQATGDLAGAKAYQTTVSTRFSDGSGVNVDHELGLMIRLQASYQANAKIIQTSQALFAALLDATR
jgi:flagellar hook-associated protein 1 FlgK